MNDDMNNGFNRESTNNEATNTVKSEVVQSSVEKKKLPIIPIIIVGVLIIGAIIFIVSSNKNSNMEGTNNSSNNSSNNNNNNNSNNNGSTSSSKKPVVITDWKKLEFSIGGVKKQLPLTEEELLDGLAEGWELSENRSYAADNVQSARLSYNGTDKSIDDYVLLVYINKLTQKIVMVGFTFDEREDKSTVEVNGISGSSTEKDVKDILGTPGSGSHGKYFNDYSQESPSWLYYYYVNGTDNTDGYVSFYGDNDDKGLVEMITIMDTRNWPKEENDY